MRGEAGWAVTGHCSSISLRASDQCTSAMAKHIPLLLPLLLLFLRGGERNGLSVAAGSLEDDQDLQVKPSNRQQVSAQSERVHSSRLSVDVKESESHIHDGKDDGKTLPAAAFRPNHTEPINFSFARNAEEQSVIVNHPESSAKSPTPERHPGPTVNHEKRSTLTNGEVEDVINDHGRAAGSGETYALHPELRLETGVHVLPERAQERSKWVTQPEDSPSGPRARRRRSWLWNQFFVIEEYQGPEPVLIGRVRCCHCWFPVCCVNVYE